MINLGLIPKLGITYDFAMNGNDFLRQSAKVTMFHLNKKGTK